MEPVGRQQLQVVLCKRDDNRIAVGHSPDLSFIDDHADLQEAEQHLVLARDYDIVKFLFHAMD